MRISCGRLITVLGTASFCIYLYTFSAYERVVLWILLWTGYNVGPVPSLMNELNESLTCVCKRHSYTSYKKFSLGSLSFFSARKSKWRSYLSSCRGVRVMKWRHALDGEEWKRTHFWNRNVITALRQGEAPHPPSQPGPRGPSQNAVPRGQCSLSTWALAPCRHLPSPPLPGAPSSSPSILSLA